MRLTESAEELLEELWILTQEDSLNKVTIEDVNRNKSRRDRRKRLHGIIQDSWDSTLEELLEIELIQKTDNILQLTEKGYFEARSIIRRHRLAERLLVDVLATKIDTAEDVACSFEHSIYEGIEENVCTLLGHPTTCPHGKPIPPGRCCQRTLETVPPLIAPLSRLRSGQRGTIAYIRTQSDQRLKKIIATGTIPGSSIQLIQKFPSYVFQVGNTQFAVDEEMANEIYIRLGNP
ncbi:MAG: metal-dependent transcriptional regulator [Candidatus Hodarchaeota archaeon]